MARCLTISDFNTSNFTGYLCNTEDLPKIDVIDCPFGQVQPLLIDETAACWSTCPDAVVIWTRPQAVIHSLDRLLNYEEVEIDRVLYEVDLYADMLIKIAGRAKTVMIPTWVLPTHVRGLGILDVKHSRGFRHILQKMNLRLSEKLSSLPDYFLLDAQKWIEHSGAAAFNPKLWYMGKIPFGNQVFKQAAEEVKTVLRAISGIAKKLVILDLDDTVWGGVVGDVGKDNVVLGGHDPEGEALVDFQKSLKALTNRGILLGIVSKNEQDVALEAIQHHPEMVLRLEDFAGWRINWDDKAKNVLELVDELNLGLDAVVFIDDNPVERARVREALPGVFVPEWPKDKLFYRKALTELSCFDVPAFTSEDRERSKMYASDRERKSLLADVTSLDDWLHSLEIAVQIEALDSHNLVRTAQLINKTNQMNLSTRRLTESELLDWVQVPENHMCVFRVSDRFGDSGLTGILGLQRVGARVQIVDFVLSCRVIGRKVEEAMLATAVQFARKNGAVDVFAEYRPTAKNKPCLDFFSRCGFACEADGAHFRWGADRDYSFPGQIRIEGTV